MNDTSCTMKKIATLLRIPTLLKDVIGITALMVMLYTGLWMPAFL
ncbi:MAG: hypothetical protein AAFP13_10860 [Pseudomonadota bacterium]